MNNSSENEEQSIADLYLNFKHELSDDDLSEEELYIQIAIHKANADFHLHEVNRLKANLNAKNPKKTIGRPKITNLEEDELFLSALDIKVREISVSECVSEKKAIIKILRGVCSIEAYSDQRISGWAKTLQNRLSDYRKSK